MRLTNMNRSKEIERQNEKMGAAIKAALTEKGMTQGRLARRLDVTEALVSRWITGQTSPSLYNIVRIARLLDLDLTELMKEIADE